MVNCSVEIAALKFTDVMIKQPLAKQKKKSVTVHYALAVLIFFTNEVYLNVWACAQTGRAACTKRGLISDSPVYF